MLSALALLLLPRLAAEEPVFTVYLGTPLISTVQCDEKEAIKASEPLNGTEREKRRDH